MNIKQLEQIQTKMNEISELLEADPKETYDITHEVVELGEEIQKAIGLLLYRKYKASKEKQRE